MTQDELINLYLAYKSTITNDRKALDTILEALAHDILHGTCEFQDLYIATHSFYGA